VADDSFEVLDAGEIAADYLHRGLVGRRLDGLIVRIRIVATDCGDAGDTGTRGHRRPRGE
jgi:hypothetical protein